MCVHASVCVCVCACKCLCVCVCVCVCARALLGTFVVTLLLVRVLTFFFGGGGGGSLPCPVGHVGSFVIINYAYTGLLCKVGPTETAIIIITKCSCPHTCAVVVCAGEQIITQAESALRFAPYSDRKQGISGNLFVTNFKVSFVTADKSSYTDKEVGIICSFQLSAFSLLFIAVYKLVQLTNILFRVL